MKLTFFLFERNSAGVCLVILYEGSELVNTLLIRRRMLCRSDEWLCDLSMRMDLITVMKFGYAQAARPGALGRRCERWRQTIHMVSTITVVTEQQLILF